jgi:hypothetical protein
MRCNFDELVRYLDQNKKMTVDERLAVLGHIDECEICRDVIYQLCRDRDARLFEYRPYRDSISVA